MKPKKQLTIENYRLIHNVLWEVRDEAEEAVGNRKLTVNTVLWEVRDEAEETVDDRKVTVNTDCSFGGERWGRRSS
jgi:hypothetical protein